MIGGKGLSGAKFAPSDVGSLASTVFRAAAALACFSLAAALGAQDPPPGAAAAAVP